MARNFVFVEGRVINLNRINYCDIITTDGQVKVKISFDAQKEDFDLVLSGEDAAKVIGVMRLLS